MAYVVIPIQVVDSTEWIKIIVPLDTLHMFNKTVWRWWLRDNDAFPEGFVQSQNMHKHSFRMQTRLFGAIPQDPLGVWNLLGCKRTHQIYTEHYIKQKCEQSTH